MADGTIIILRYCYHVQNCLLLHFFIDNSWVSNGLRMSSPQASSFLVSACLLLVVVLPSTKQDVSSTAAASAPGTSFRSDSRSRALQCSCLWRRKIQGPEAPRGSEVPRFRPPLHPSSLRMPVVSWPAAVMQLSQLSFCVL